MYSLAPAFSIVMIERVDKMKKVIEHPRPLQDGSLALFAITGTHSYIPIRGLIRTY
jgi:hypothetical protein